MKRIILIAILLVLGLGLNAQHKQTVLMENLPKKAEFFPLSGKYGLDFVYIHDADSPEHGNSQDAILCINKQGIKIREIPVVHPKMDVVGLVEDVNNLKIIYHKQARRTDSIFIATVNKEQENYTWAPKTLLAAPSKEVDEVLFSVSPNGKKFLIGKYMEKKKNLTVDMMVFNENSDVVYEKAFKATNEEKHLDGIEMLVANDGSSYCVFTTRTKSRNSAKCKCFVYMYYANQNEFLFSKKQSYFNVPGIVTPRGDYMKIWATGSDTKVVGFNIEKKESFDKTENFPIGFFDNQWMFASCSKTRFSAVTHAIRLPIGETSGTMLFESYRRDWNEVQRTSTSTYKDKNGKVKTTTTTYYETILTIEHTGDIISVTYNLQDEKFIFNTLFKRQRCSSKSGVSEDYTLLSYRAIQEGKIARIYYVDNYKNYEDDGDEDNFGKFNFLAQYPCWATATLGADGLFSQRKMAVKYSDCDFNLKEVLISYDNYWVILTQGDTRRKSHIGVFRY